MVSLAEVENQLKRLGVTFHFWGRSEMRELPKILVPGEHIKACVNGRYEGGFAMLCATDQRLLLIDKKPFFLMLEDLRYDKVAEVKYNYRLIESTINLHSAGKPFVFSSWRQKDLRELTYIVQQRVTQAQQFTAGAPSAPAPEPVDTSQPVAYSVGELAVETSSGELEEQRGGLGLPAFTNPYTSNNLLIRRRVTRWDQFRPSA